MAKSTKTEATEPKTTATTKTAEPDKPKKRVSPPKLKPVRAKKKGAKKNVEPPVLTHGVMKDGFAKFSAKHKPKKTETQPEA